MRVNDAPRLRGWERRLVGRCREWTALIVTLTRFCAIVHPLVRRQLAEWETLAARIPDPILREQALGTLRSERLSAAGAAMFAATAPRLGFDLVAALVAFQVAWDYLDTLSEQPVEDPVRNGARLHGALVDALAHGPGDGDWYRHHPSDGDGGYLGALVACCRRSCERLPAYAHVRATAVRETRRVTVQGINHAPEHVREPRLRAWAREQEGAGDVAWFELAAAASSSMGILALLTSAADARTTAAGVERVRAAYVPWVDALTTLLDSHVDADDDAVTGALSFVAHYPSAAAARGRLTVVCRRAHAAVRRLPHPERHVVLIAGMTALHLSHASAWTAHASATTRAVIAASDTGVLLALLALLRTWRGARRRQLADPPPTANRRNVRVRPRVHV